MGLPSATFQSRGISVLASREYGLAVGAECHGKDRILMRERNPMGLPSATFQSRAVLSWLPVSTALPSGLNATAKSQS